MDEFFVRLTAILDDIGLTNYKLAKLLGTSEANISNYRNGKAKPGAEFLSILLKNYEVYNMNWLFSGKGKMKMKAGQNIDVEQAFDKAEILKQIDNLSTQIKELRDKVK